MRASSNVDSGPALPHVVPASREHLESMVSCHVAVFPEEVITRLGRSFLRVHHRFYIDDPEGFCFVAVDDVTGRVGGLVIGGSPQLRRRFVMKHLLCVGFRFFYKAFSDRLVRYRIRLAARRMLRRLFIFRRAGERSRTPPPPQCPWAFLWWIGTHPDFRRRGVGNALMEAFEKQCIDRSYTKMRLTVAVDNAAAVALYEKLGWKIIATADRLHYLERDIGGRVAGASNE